MPALGPPRAQEKQGKSVSTRWVISPPSSTRTTAPAGAPSTPVSATDAGHRPRQRLLDPAAVTERHDDRRSVRPWGRVHRGSSRSPSSYCPAHGTTGTPRV